MPAVLRNIAETWLKRGHGERVVSVAIAEFGGAHVVFACNRAQTRQQQFQLVGFRKLRLEQTALCGLRLCRFRIERDAQNAGSWRVCLQLQIHQLE